MTHGVALLRLKYKSDSNRVCLVKGGIMGLVFGGYPVPILMSGYTDR